MIYTKVLTSATDVEELIARSYHVPCLIFKHSTRCSISSIAKMRLEEDWSFSSEVLEAYYLDVIAHRPASLHIAETCAVHHESPQVLLLSQGECVYDASHLDITVQEVEEAMTFSQLKVS